LKNQTVESCSKSLEEAQTALQSLQNGTSNKEKVDELTEKIEEALKEEEALTKKIEALTKKIEATKAWEINFKNFKSHVANQSISNIADYTNLFLQSMGTNLSISIEGYRTLSNKKISEKITTQVLRNGLDAGSYGKFSGGERGRIDIAAILGLQELINLNCPFGTGLDLLVIDEVMDQVDPLGLESIIGSLQSLGKIVMIVSQQSDINALKEHTITICKKNRNSFIID
jgi:exonuclease SbcC